MENKPDYYRIIARDPNGSGLAWAEHIKGFKPLGDGRVLVTDWHDSVYFADMNDIITGIKVVHRAAGGNICKILMEGDK